MPVIAWQVATDQGVELEQTLKLVALMALSAGGAAINYASYPGGDMGGVEWAATLAARPTLITLMLAIVAYRFGRSEFAADAPKRAVKQAALFAALGFAGVAWAVSWVVQGTFSASYLTTLTLLPLSWIDIALIVLVIGGAAWLGGIRGAKDAAAEAGSAFTVTVWEWARLALSNFARLYFGIIAAAFFIYVVYRVVEPDWVYSTPEVASPPTDWGSVAKALLVILLYLPTILFTILGVGAGANYGITSSGGFGYAPGWEQLYALISGAGFTSISALGAGGKWLLIGVALFVSFAGLAAGAAAARKLKFRLTGALHLVQGIAGIVPLSLFLLYVTSWTATSTNNGAPQSQIEAGSIALMEGSAAIGITPGSALLITTLVAVTAFFATSTGYWLVSSAFPRLGFLSNSQVFADEATAEDRLRHAGAKLFGRMATSVVVAAVAVALASVSAERVWAMIDTPLVHTDALADKLTGSDVQAVKLLLDPEEKASKWFPDEVISAALPQSTDSRTSKVINDQKKAWSVGQLDALGVVSWQTPNGKVIWRIPTEAKVDTYAKLVEHPNYKLLPQPVVFRLSINSLMPDAYRGSLKVNGKAISEGTYAAAPGRYHVTMDGYKLIAPTDRWLVTDRYDFSFEAGNDTKLPAGADSKLQASLTAKLAACMKVSKYLESECFDVMDIWQNREIASGELPNDWFDSSTRSSSVKSQKCEAAYTDSIITASEMQRKWDCTQEFEFSETYYDYAYETRPRYEQQPYYYMCGWSVCVGYRTYYVGDETITVRGKALATVKYRSTMKFSVTVRGVLNDNNLFTAAKAAVK